MIRSGSMGVLIVAVLGAGAPAQGQVGLESDDAFLAWASDFDFAKAFVGEMRWGRNFEPARDWELGLVRPANDGTFTDAQFIWDGPADFEFGYDPGLASAASLSVGGTALDADVSSFVSGDVNTILIRAKSRAEGGASAAMDFRGRLLSGDILFASSIVGDGDAEYLLFQNAGLSDGFVVEGSVTLADTDASTNYGSDPAVQLKVGTATVPEPQTVVLLASGLLALALVARRRREAQDGGNRRESSPGPPLCSSRTSSGRGLFHRTTHGGAARNRRAGAGLAASSGPHDLAIRRGRNRRWDIVHPGARGPRPPAREQSFWRSPCLLRPGRRHGVAWTGPSRCRGPLRSGRAPASSLDRSRGPPRLHDFGDGGVRKDLLRRTGMCRGRRGVRARVRVASVQRRCCGTPTKRMSIPVRYGPKSPETGGDWWFVALP